MPFVATSLIAGLIESPQGLSEFIRLGLVSELFRGPEEEEAFSLLTQWVGKYGTMPLPTLFTEAGITLPAAPQPLAYYADQLMERYVHLTLKQGVLDVQQCLNADKPQLAQEVMTDVVLRLTKTKSKTKLVNFTQEGHKIILDEMKAKKLQGDEHGVKFGWPTLDNMADGLTGGDVVTIVGRPGQGKTYAMLYTSSYAWMFQNKRPMFVTMEMKPLPIIQRLAAMNAKKPITQLKKAELSTAAEKELFKKLEAYKGKNDFWVVDGALSSTVTEIILLARQLKPDVVWIDGAYLLRSINNRLQRWERITEVLEQVKGDLAEALNLPVIISFQFNRQGSKKGDASLENIAYSDAVGQLSSVVLGLGIADDEDNVENLYRRRVQILKGRNGEVGDFHINWRFDQGPDFMNFTEQTKITQEDLSYGME